MSNVVEKSHLDHLLWPIHKIYKYIWQGLKSHLEHLIFSLKGFDFDNNNTFLYRVIQSAKIQ